MNFDDQQEKSMDRILEDLERVQQNLERTQAITEENAKAIAENAEKTSKAIAENAEKTSKVIAENAERTTKAIEKTNQAVERANQAAERANQAAERANQAVEKNIKDTERWRKQSKNYVEGRIGNKVGEIVEVVTTENLTRLLKERGFIVYQIYGNVRDEKGQKWELDIVATNGEEVVIVEVKTSMTVKDVKLFIEKKLPRIREYLPQHKDKKIYGAVSYLKSKIEVSDKKTDKEGRNASKYAQEQGLFVINVSGETANMLNNESFTPKAF